MLQSATAGTAVEMPFFSKPFLFHFFYCKVIKKRSSSNFFRSVSLFRASNVRIHQKQKATKSSKWNNEDKRKTLLLGTLLLPTFACTFCTMLKKVETKCQKSWKSFVSHFMALRSLSPFFALVLPFSNIFPLSLLRTIDPQSRNNNKFLPRFFASLFTLICFMIYR